MNDIIKKILAPTGNLPTLYHGTTRNLWTKDPDAAMYLRLTTKLTTAQRHASHAAVDESDQGSMTGDGVVIAFTPVALKRLLSLGYALEADPAYLRDPYLPRNFSVEPVTARAWQYSLTAYHGVVISGFLHEHKRGLTVMNDHAAEVLGSLDVVPYPVLSNATCLADLRIELDRAVTQLTLNAIHYRTSGVTSLHLTDCINRVNGLTHAMACIDAEQLALAARTARSFPEDSGEFSLGNAVLNACNARATSVNNQGAAAQVDFLLGEGCSVAEILTAAGLEEAKPD